LKLGRSLYATVTSIAACSLLIQTLTEGQISSTRESWCLAGYVQRVSVALVCCVAVAMGVMWLGWYWLRLGRAIASIAMPFEDARAQDVKAGRSVWTWLKRSEVEKLCRAVREHLDGCTAHVAQYEKQIRDLRLQIQLSQKREKNTEAIIYGIRDAVIVIDEYDKLLMANEAAGRLFGFDFRNAQHQPLSELIGSDRAEFAELLSHSAKSKNQATRRELGFCEEGEQRTFDCIVSCVYDQSRQVCGVVAVLHDITREKQIQQMKNDFVSHVSHELKTPLASITAYSEMLADGEAGDEETRKEFYSVIQNQAQRLNRLIEDILNTSRIESGLVKVNKDLVSLTMLIEEQLQMIKSYAEEKNIEVVAQTPIVFDRVYVDRDMMSQVIVNLLSNAVKYTPSGGSVRIETTVDEAASVVRVTVTDTGVGIPEDEVARVFDKFYRVGANKKQATGTGLGLTLVKQIIEQVHEGHVFVTSQVGVGSTFGFELPLATRESAGIV
jgi:two-component system, OmpR family, phosphate regulon sensor histidine kinase PhoR